jgi:hypothetical protein
LNNYYVRKNARQIVLGEHIPPSTTSKEPVYTPEGYIFQGYVDVQALGSRATRGMSIYTRKGSIFWDRITIYGNDYSGIAGANQIWNPMMKRWSKGTGEEEINNARRDQRYGETFKEKYMAKNDNKQKRMTRMVHNIGPFIEVMFMNAAVIFAHVPLVGKKARNNLLNAIKELNHADYHFIGDLNYQLNESRGGDTDINQTLKTKDGTKTKYDFRFNYHNNSNLNNILSQSRIGNEQDQLFSKTQEDNRKHTSGKINNNTTRSSLHDGVVSRIGNTRSKLEIVDATWPISYLEDSLRVTSDHKAIFGELTVWSNSSLVTNIPDPDAGYLTDAELSDEEA